MNAPAFRRSGPSAFAREKAAAKREAPCTVEMAPAFWADNRPAKPTVPVKVGLRLVSEKDFEHASERAAKEACIAHPNAEDMQVEHYNNRLMGLVMAEATCRPDDVATPYFAIADAKIFLDLTPEGIRYLWDHYEALAISTSPTAPEATDEELDLLTDGLTSGELIVGLGIEQARRVRRLLRAALAEAGV